MKNGRVGVQWLPRAVLLAATTLLVAACADRETVAPAEGTLVYRVP
jgi:type IV pilus biogenesis protein CpaD/CtpE